MPPADLEPLWLSPRTDGPVRLALGAMNFGKRTDASESERLIERALERAIALIDTANVYNGGESERIVGRAVRGRRDAVLIATKVGLGRPEGKPEGLSRAAIQKAVEGSLARLGTEYIDLYFLHAPDHGTPIEETIDAIADLLRRGVIRHFGVSNYASWQILEIMHLCDARGIERPRVSQVMYNLLVRHIESEHLRFTRRYRVHTTVYNPLAGGLLSGKYQKGDAIQKGSRFDNNSMYQRRYWSDRLLELVGEYRTLAAEQGMSLLEYAYAWLASAPGVDSILVGPASLEHLDAALDACEMAQQRGGLSADARARATAIHDAFAGTDASYVR